MRTITVINQDERLWTIVHINLDPEPGQQNSNIFWQTKLNTTGSKYPSPAMPEV